jgi:hypothetical protein
MTRLVSGLCCLFIFCSAFADEVKDAPIPETMNTMGIAAFFILFIGMCVGFFAWMWWKNKQDKEGKEGKEK